MKEGDYIQRLRTLWPREGDASLKAISMADAAVAAFPRSALLWCMRGDLIQLGPVDCPYGLDEALTSYRRAVEIDPRCAEAWEEISHHYDTVWQVRRMG